MSFKEKSMSRATIARAILMLVGIGGLMMLAVFAQVAQAGPVP
jgi:uncharacterized membrane protein YuzA (DUF378 family)